MIMNTERTTKEELLQQKLFDGRITWLEYMQQGEHGAEFQQYCEDNRRPANERTAQQFWDSLMKEEEQWQS